MQARSGRIPCRSHLLRVTSLQTNTHRCQNIIFKREKPRESHEFPGCRAYVSSSSAKPDQSSRSGSDKARGFAHRNTACSASKARMQAFSQISFQRALLYLNSSVLFIFVEEHLSFSILLLLLE